MTARVRVELPSGLSKLAGVQRELELAVDGPVTQRSILDALESRLPMLQGTIRDHDSQICRPFIRFFGCQQDLSHELPDAPLPDEIAQGHESFLIVGAVAGG